MKYILPRTIYGNRGDIASRWGVLRALHLLDIRDVTVYSRAPEDVPRSLYPSVRYRPFRNLLVGEGHWNRLREADHILWSVGLDLQDDSSLAKLMYLWVTFHLYRRLDLKIWCLFQGAGPLSTKVGRWLAGSVLGNVDIFVARDPGTFRLIRKVSPNIKSILAHDAIFLPGFENDLILDDLDETKFLNMTFPDDNRPAIGFNIRQWFHFVSSVLPYQFSQGIYRNRSQDKMSYLIRASVELIKKLRKQDNLRVVLISAYQPGIVPWEDDLPWLTAIKVEFKDDDDVLLVDKPLSMMLYYALISRLEFVVGMRLHSSLIALRLGVPALNLNYTLKGKDILEHVGLSDHVIDLQTFMDDPGKLADEIITRINNLSLERKKIARAVGSAIDQNMKVLNSLFQRK